MRQLFAAILAIAYVLFSPAVSAQEQKDHFIGTLVLEDADPSEGRKFRLGQDLTYVDPKGVSWYAGKGLVFDGASIPQALWSIVGSPYTGLYRRAAVIHDYYCTYLYRKWESVHRAFYDAMITDGVSKFKALAMYYAVFRFGPRWTVAKQTNCPSGHSCITSIITRIDITRIRPKPSQINEADLKREFSDIEKFIQDTDPSPDMIETLVSQKAAAPAEISTKTLRGFDALNYGSPFLSK